MDIENFLYPSLPVQEEWKRHKRVVNPFEDQPSLGKKTKNMMEYGFGVQSNYMISKTLEQNDVFSLYKLGGVKGIARALKTNLETGIHGNEDDITRRKKEFGLNSYKKPLTRSFYFFCLKAFKDHKILFLLVYALFSLAVGIENDVLMEGLSDGGRIFFAIALAATISTAREFCTELIMSNMSSDINVKVIRGGLEQNTSISNVVVGDVVFLKTGDHIPADGLFLRGHSLRVTNSSKARYHQNVNIYEPYLSAGGKVADGSCYMLVTSVGMNTSWGRLMSSSYCDFDEKTPLQARLRKLTVWIRWIILIISLLILAVMLVRYWLQSQEIDGNKKRKKEMMKAMPRIFTAAITIPVMVIPEDFPIIVTLTFAYLRRTVIGNHALFQNLSALETMGTVTTICTEKMDMLNLEEMKVTKFCVGEEVLTGDNFAIDPKVLSLLHQAVGLNSTSNVSSTSLTQTSVSRAIQRAILHWATLELGMDLENFRQFYTILHVEGFKANKKGCQVLLRQRNTKNSFDHVHWEGTAEMIVSLCSHYYTREGNLRVINQERRRRFEQSIQGMAAHYIQCIAFAHKYNVREQRNEESGLTLLGLVGLKKQFLEPNVRKAVEACIFAGVDVKMMTRVDAFTAGSIATECGILHADRDFLGAVVEGQEFRNYSDDLRMEMVDQIHVMASSSRSDKLRMVRCLKRRGQIVAAIGDYEDDVLKESNVRLLINIHGTENVKENSDIVILDDGFASIEKLVKCGRCIHKNAHNFLQFQLTVIIVTLVVNCVTAVATYRIQISAVQVLWESLIVETLGALALAAERPTEELMLKGPVSPEETLITITMWRNIISQALYQIMLLLVLQFKSSSIFHVDGSVSGTLTFNTFVLCQACNLFNSRNLEKRNAFEGIQDNRLFLWIVGMIVSLQVLMVELLDKFACTKRLDWRLWAASVGMAAMSWPIAFVAKGIPISNATKALRHLYLIFNSFLTRVTVGTSRRKEWTHIL